MSKIKYYKTSAKKKKPTKIDSIVGKEYLMDFKQRLKSVDESRRSNEQTMRLSDRAFISQFSDLESKSHPSITFLADQIKKEIEKMDSRYSAWGNIVYSCVLLCDDDEFAASSQKIRKLKLPEDITEAHSHKFRNLMFNWKKLLGSLLDAALFCSDFNEQTAIKLIYVICNTILTGGKNITELSRVEFDEISAIILHCIAKISLDNWIDEEYLIDRVIQEHSNLQIAEQNQEGSIDRNLIATRITQLENKYHCIEIDDGKVRLVEKVLID